MVRDVFYEPMFLQYQAELQDWHRLREDLVDAMSDCFGHVLGFYVSCNSYDLQVVFQLN